MHTTPEYKDELKKHGMEPMQWDGMGEMHVKSIEDWVKFQGSPAFEKLVRESVPSKLLISERLSPCQMTAGTSWTGPFKLWLGTII